jgi:hypothetical protein
MGKFSSSAPAADPAIGEAALKEAQTGEAWLAFAKDSFAVSQERQKELDALTTKVTEQQLGLATDQATWSKEDRARYNSVYKPIEDQYIAEATNYASDEKQAEAAAGARADVQTAAANARSATERQAASMGIDPTSGRFAGVQATTDMNATLAEAGAANGAREAVRDKGLALKADVANMGRGYASSAGTAAGGSVGASATALSGAQSTNSQSMAANNIMGAGFQGAMQGYSGQAATLNQQFGIQSNNWQAQQSANAQGAAGIGTFLGGLFASPIFKSDENLKEDIQDIPEGEGINAMRKMPVSEWSYKEGVEDGGRHVGTMAQDFQRATGKGDGQSIPVVDAIGITMKAVQDLDQKVEKLAGMIGLGDHEKAETAEEEAVEDDEMSEEEDAAAPPPMPAKRRAKRNTPMIGINFEKEAA